MTSNQVRNKVITNELLNDIKPRAPLSSPTHSALTSKQAKMLKKIAVKGSSSEEEEGDASKCSSSDEKKVIRPKLLKHAKLYFYGY